MFVSSASLKVGDRELAMHAGYNIIALNKQRQKEQDSRERYDGKDCMNIINKLE